MKVRLANGKQMASQTKMSCLAPSMLDIIDAVSTIYESVKNAVIVKRPTVAAALVTKITQIVVQQQSKSINLLHLISYDLYHLFTYNEVTMRFYQAR